MSLVTVTVASRLFCFGPRSLDRFQQVIARYPAKSDLGPKAMPWKDGADVFLELAYLLRIMAMLPCFQLVLQFRMSKVGEFYLFVRESSVKCISLHQNETGVAVR
ncbi:hypothetical protein C27AD_18973 [Salinisphaera hydrothermalis C27AD]